MRLTRINHIAHTSLIIRTDFINMFMVDVLGLANPYQQYHIMSDVVSVNDRQDCNGLLNLRIDDILICMMFNFSSTGTWLMCMKAMTAKLP